MKIIPCFLKRLPPMGKEGGQRWSVEVTREANVILLGYVERGETDQGEDFEFCLWIADPEKEPRQTVTLEFISIRAGEPLPPNSQFRGSVHRNHEAAGPYFFFERKNQPQIIVPAVGG